MFSLLIPQTTGQWQTVGYFFALLILLLGVSEFTARRFKLPQEFSRKSVHIVVGLLVVVFSINIQAMQPITFLSFLFTIINAIVLKFDLMPSMGSERKSYGTIFYPFTILISAIFLWDHFKVIFLILVLVLALADAIAAMVGQNWKNPKPLIILRDKKTIPGTLAMWAASSVIIYALLLWYGITPTYNPVIVAILSGLFIAAAEMVSIDGSDNISIGIATIIILLVFTDRPVEVQDHFLQAILFGVLLGGISYKLKFLEAGGAIITFLIAVMVYGVGQWKWTVPILLFFFTASILSKAGKNKKRKYDLLYEKNSNRDGFQVLANGGIAFLASLVYFFSPASIWYAVFVVSLAAANADTWATEIGVFSKSNPRLITNFQMVAKGRSGAVSIFGTLGSLMGAFVVAASILSFSSGGWTQVVILTVSGLLASFVDSILGATLQAQYIDAKTGNWTERNTTDGVANKLVHGCPRLNNDGVNFIATVSAPLFYILLHNVL